MNTETHAHSHSHTRPHSWTNTILFIFTKWYLIICCWGFQTSSLSVPHAPLDRRATAVMRARGRSMRRSHWLLLDYQICGRCRWVLIFCLFESLQKPFSWLLPLFACPVNSDPHRATLLWHAPALKSLACHSFRISLSHLTEMDLMLPGRTDWLIGYNHLTWQEIVGDVVKVDGQFVKHSIQPVCPRLSL